MDRALNLGWVDYWRALASARKRGVPEVPLARSSLAASGVDLDGPKLAPYREICGFDAGGMPPTWPQVVAMPLLMRQLSAPAFPLPVPGLVHVENTIDVVRAGPLCGVRLEAAIGASTHTDSGIQLDLDSAAADADGVFWRSRALTLFRTPGRGSRRRRRRRDTRPMRHRVPLAAPADLGRRYARVSGDYNPIHLWPLTAKPFGFDRAVVHGMWSLAAALAVVDDGPADAPRRIYAAFRRPIFLPASLAVRWDDDAAERRFDVVDEAASVCLHGTIRPAETSQAATGDDPAA